MIYNNILFFLAVIFIFSTDTPPVTPWLSFFIALPLFLFMLYGFSRIASRAYGRLRIDASADYFGIEKKLTLLAVLLFAFFVYGLDLRYYLQPLSFGGTLPVIESIAGLSLFFLLLAIIWFHGRTAYQDLFQCSYTAGEFILSNTKANLPVILPWLVISFTFNLLSLLPFPSVHNFLATPWGDLVLFAVLISFLLLFFPPLVRWLWNCQPIPAGPDRHRVESFCHKLGFAPKILYWPLFEGRVMTAAILGAIPGFRYLLVTRALLDRLNDEELNSVLAHEIGHVKKRHMLLLALLFLSFSVLLGVMFKPLYYLLLSNDLFYQTVEWLKISPDTLLVVLGIIPLLIFMLIYFRFIFGYFIRNFERQADLYVFKAQGTSSSLISSFEKIAVASGNIRDQKCWHHFGIGERINFLKECENNRNLITRHNRKILYSLAGYFICIITIVIAMQQMDPHKLAAGYEVKYTKAVLQHKMRQDPSNSLWLLLLGNLMQEHQMETKAINAYEQALVLEPMSAEINNNFAWLLLTATDKSLRDPVRALTLARTAAIMQEEGFILDTLAHALWANSLIEEAIATIINAAQVDPANKKYYHSQLKRFITSSWNKPEP